MTDTRPLPDPQPSLAGNDDRALDAAAMDRLDRDWDALVLGRDGVSWDHVVADGDARCIDALQRRYGVEATAGRRVWLGATAVTKQLPVSSRLGPGESQRWDGSGSQPLGLVSRWRARPSDLLAAAAVVVAVLGGSLGAWWLPEGSLFSPAEASAEAMPTETPPTEAAASPTLPAPGPTAPGLAASWERASHGGRDGAAGTETNGPVLWLRGGHEGPTATVVAVHPAR